MAPTLTTRLTGSLLLPTFHFSRECSCPPEPDIWTYETTTEGGSLLTIEVEPFAPNGNAPASPDLIFGTALTPARKPSDAS